MPYPPQLVEPMREEARQMGCEELLTSEAVEAAIAESPGTLLVLVNSVCGCAAGGARPGLGLALKNSVTPDKVVTVFAGQDLEATASVRERFGPYQPSSPQIALLKGSEIVFMLQRHDIEGRPPEAICADLTKAFEEHCTS